MHEPNTFRLEGGLLIPLGYNAITDKGRRQAPRTVVTSEDAQLTAANRASLTATTSDLWRNFEVAKWMVSLHVAYVSRFEPFCNSGSPELDAEVIRLLEWHGRKENFDLSQRFSRKEAMALFEIAKVFCGDAALLKLKTGNVQAIPGKRLACPKAVSDKDADRWAKIKDSFGPSTGLKVDSATGRILQAVICRWDATGKQLTYDHVENWQNLIYDGYFVDLDQYRGISPIASAINRLTDVYESMEWVHLKVKLHALFGLAFERGGQGASVFGAPPNPEAPTPSKPYSVDPTKGFMVLDLDPGDKVTTVESNTPSNEFVDYTGLSLRVALLSLDIPYTFLDSKGSSFSASIAETNRYEFLAADKRAKNRAVLDAYSDWQLERWMSSSDPRFAELRKLANAAGKDLAALQAATDWIGAETPWVDQEKQLGATEKAIDLALTSRQREGRRRGQGPWINIAQELEFETKILKAAGIERSDAKPKPAQPKPEE
jgi:capsid protein